MIPLPRPSPNFNNRPEGVGADILILHYTGMKTAEEALDRLCDHAAQVSAHYTVDEKGQVFSHVAEDKRAWHAGVSHWAGETDVNGRSIGIEIVNPGHEFGYRPFPDQQMAAVQELALGILRRHPIPPHRVIGHSDVAPDRKQDPGELFDWQRLAQAGIGIWPEEGLERHNAVPSANDLSLGERDASNLKNNETSPNGPVGNYQTHLLNFGYGLPVDGQFNDQTRLVTIALQRHFLPDLIGGPSEGVANERTQTVAKWLSDVAISAGSVKASS